LRGLKFKGNKSNSIKEWPCQDGYTDLSVIKNP